MYSGPFDGSPVNTYIHGVTGISGTNEEILTMVLFLNLEIKLKPSQNDKVAIGMSISSTFGQ